MSLHAIVDAHEQGYDENVYLDPGSRTFIEETGGANIIFITRDGKVVTPKIIIDTPVHNTPFAACCG